MSKPGGFWIRVKAWKAVLTEGGGGRQAGPRGPGSLAWLPRADAACRPLPHGPPRSVTASRWPRCCSWRPQGACVRVSALALHFRGSRCPVEGPARSCARPAGLPAVPADPDPWPLFLGLLLLFLYCPCPALFSSEFQSKFQKFIFREASSRGRVPDPTGQTLRSAGGWTGCCPSQLPCLGLSALPSRPRVSVCAARRGT